jgi:hypothetical protein
MASNPMAIRFRRLLPPLAILLLGVVVGGYLFRDARPRSVLALDRCTDCMRPADLAGLLGSLEIAHAPGLVPFVVIETNRTIAIKEPLPGGHLHYVIVPKRDLKNIADITPADSAYLMDAMLVVRRLVEKDHMRNYRLYTNGPGLQSVTYLHFHLEDDYH